MVALAVKLPLFRNSNSTTHQNLSFSRRSCCSILRLPSSNLVHRQQVNPARFSVSSVLSSPSPAICPIEHSAKFLEASRGANLVPLHQCIFSDHLTPVLAYRCLVNDSDQEAPSFLFESVEPGLHALNVGRYSIVGANPAMEIVAKENLVTVMNHREGWRREKFLEDPLLLARKITEKWIPQHLDELPQVFCGGWVGYFSYDTVRYAEKTLEFSSGSGHDRNLPDVHLGLYDDVLVFDHVEKRIHVIHWVQLDRFSSTEEALEDGMNRLESLLSRVHNIVNPRLPPGSIEPDTPTPKFEVSCTTSEAYKKAISKAKEHILAGDLSEVVLSQQFERRTFSNPFDVYRALGVVNPSPFMAYIQVRGCVLVASSSDILACAEEKKKTNINGSHSEATKRKQTPKEDALFSKQVVNGEKQYHEQIMLADWETEDLEKVTDVCRCCWDALRAALPPRTVTGVPKIKAMKLIDELEVKRRGPYGGGFGFISFSGDMDIALASGGTIVFPTEKGYDTLYSYKNMNMRREWVAHLHAGATVVADSDLGDVERECEREAASLARAIDLAESSFLDKDFRSG